MSDNTMEKKEEQLREAAEKFAKLDTMTGSTHHKKLVERLIKFSKSETVKEYYTGEFKDNCPNCQVCGCTTCGGSGYL